MPSYLSKTLLGALILYVCFQFCACQENTTIHNSGNSWPKSTNETKPWTRWWWHGSAVTKKGISKELEAYSAAGIGGVELTPIYGVKGKEEAFIPFLSEQWVEMLQHTLQEAERLGLGVDMATGTGWPFGGPWVTEDNACKYIVHKKYKVKNGQRFNQKIEFHQSPILRTVNNPSLQHTDIKFPIAQNQNLQELAIDQVRFEQALPLISLMAFEEGGKTIDLTTKVKDGILDWTATEGNWMLYAVFQGLHGKMVERSAPGGEGNVLDHFSRAALSDYLLKFNQAFEGKDISSIRAFFNDSYEVDDAHGQADWTPLLFDKFKEKRGYDLRQYLPALFSDEEHEKNTRVKSDYRETIADLLLESFTKQWSSWAKGHNAIIRNQAHGSPANILDLYAASDIPETEGNDLIKAKMASSAAHLSGKKLVSAESATWLNEHFSSNIGDLKENIDRYFTAGINHIFYHGTCYSPEEEAWPGRLFYAAIHANPRNSLWEDYPAINNYVERTQSFLQNGKPQNDILLYLPAHDRYATKRNENLEHFDGWATGKHDDIKTNVRLLAEWLQDKGYTFDFISDKQIADLLIKEQSIIAHGNSYKCVLVPEIKYMPLSTIHKLKELADKGASVIFDKSLPASVPGYHNLDLRLTDFEKAKEQLTTKSIIISQMSVEAFQKVKLKRESMVDEGLEFYRFYSNNDDAYFISNWCGKSFDGWLPLNSKFNDVFIFDPMTGQFGKAKTKIINDNVAVYIQLTDGASLILKTSSEAITDEEWTYINPGKTYDFTANTWTIKFTKGGPQFPKEITSDSLIYWTDIDDAAYQAFSGTAIYSSSFDLKDEAISDMLLDLGHVSESASIYVNEQFVGTSIGPVYQVRIPKSILKKDNTIDIHVSNSMANRISHLEKSGVRWQKFYNINISANKRENLGEDRVFTTKNWTPRPSGLAGPVTITTIN